MHTQAGSSDPEVLPTTLTDLAAPPARGSALTLTLLPDLAPGRLVSDAQALIAPLAPEPNGATHPPVIALADSQAGQTYVAHCPHSVLQELADTLHDLGYDIESVTPADHAWSAAAAEATGDPPRPSICVIQLQGPRPETRLLAGIADGPQALRRLPASPEPHALTDALQGLTDILAPVGGRVHVLALGDATFREAAQQAVAAAGLSWITPRGVIEDLDCAPGPVAAAFAGSGPRFVPPEVMEAARTRRARTAAWITAASAVLLACAGLLEGWNVNRELTAVRDARAELRSEVGAAIDAGNNAELLREAVAETRALRDSNPRWTAVLTDLSDRLPGSSYATSLRVVGDSLYIELEGTDASRTLDGLRDLPGITGFRAAAPVRREVGDGSRVIERFTAAATVTWPRSGDPAGGGP